jgi:hypothetical protein
MTRLGVCVVFGPERGETKVFSLHRSRKNVVPFCTLIEEWLNLERKGGIYTYDIDASRPIDAMALPGFQLSRMGRLCIGVPPKPRRMRR